MTFASSLESVFAWRRTRLQGARFLPLAAFLAWAASSAGGAAVASTLAACVIALALIAQFRLWDDLVDRARDRNAHPERLLAAAATTAPFDRVLVLLGAANAMAILGMRGVPALLGFLLLSAAAASWYRWHRSRQLTHALVLHLKYPAFVLLLAPPPLAPLAGAAIVYASIVGFELLDEPRLRTPWGHALLAGALLFLACIPLHVDSASAGPIATLGLAVIAAATVVRALGNKPVAHLRSVPFALAAVALAFVAWGGLH